jgi:hypothetical protein
MVSYDVTGLFTSKHIRSTKRSLLVVAICVNEYVSTPGKTQQKVKRKIKQIASFNMKKKGSDQKQVD